MSGFVRNTENIPVPTFLGEMYCFNVRIIWDLCKIFITIIE